MHRAVPLLSLLLLLPACSLYERLYLCQRDEQCVDGAGTAGRCVASGCAWPAADCPAGLRFDDSAGVDRAGLCVGEEPDAPRSGFVRVELPGGRGDAPHLGPLFGFGDSIFVVGWDAAPLLVRWDAGQATTLSPPLGSEVVVAASASPALLALATADRLLLSSDGGQSFRQEAATGIAALHHDGQLLHVLRGGQVESLGPDGARVDVLGAPGDGVGGVTALCGDGAEVLALVRGSMDRGVVYLRQGGRWERVHEAQGPLTAAALGAGGWVAAGPGLVVLGGLGGAVQAEAPGAAQTPRQAALLGEGDLWLRGASWPYLLRRRDQVLAEVRPDPAAASYLSLRASRGPAGAELWVVSRYAADRTYRSRLWRGPLP